jgi:hypothetical protein
MPNADTLHQWLDKWGSYAPSILGIDEDCPESVREGERSLGRSPSCLDSRQIGDHTRNIGTFIFPREYDRFSRFGRNSKRDSSV